MSTSTQPGPSTATTTPPRRYWAQHIRQDGTWRIDPRNGTLMHAPGEDLAALRSGLGKGAGTVPAMWPYYTSATDGRLTIELEAEHAALALYGLHQQGQRDPMHRSGISLGAALRSLRLRGRFGEEAIDRRVAAAANTTSVPALLHRLRGLVTQLRGTPQPLDYDRLLEDIQQWHCPDTRQRVRRSWGLAYYSWSRHTPTPEGG